MKLCPACNVEKDESAFYKRYGNKPGSYCKPCARKYQRQWQQNKLTTERQRTYLRKSVYGLSPEEQDALPTECQICGTTENLHIDHDHQTGLIRGVICVIHNIGLGRFQDDPVLLLRAADYLLAHRERTEG